MRKGSPYGVGSFYVEPKGSCVCVQKSGDGEFIPWMGGGNSFRVAK